MKTPRFEAYLLTLGQALRIITIVCALGIALTLTASVACAETLTIVSWGGAYERSQVKAYFEPFTAKTGIQISVQRYNGGIEELRKQRKSARVSWDVVDLVMADNEQACELGLLEALTDIKLAPAPDGTAAEADFYPDSLTRCGVPQVISSTVLAFDVRAFPGEKPNSVAALFDLKRYPGKRALQRRPIAILEWALHSYGVPHDQLYDLLSTERGLSLAFTRLDGIKDHIVWWEDGATPPRLLAEQEVTMASGYNGRFFGAAVERDAPIQIVWDSQLYEYSTWGIPRGAPHLDNAKKFIEFATRTEQLAEQAKYISYGPARKSATSIVWKHAETGIDIRPHLPTFPPHFSRAIHKDHEWYARTQDQLRERFLQWLGE